MMHARILGADLAYYAFRCRTGNITPLFFHTFCTASKPVEQFDVMVLCMLR